MIYKQNQKGRKSFSANVVEFAGLLLIVFLIRTFFFGLYQVPTGSMETTMLVGERFFADKLSYYFRKPQRSEIISFNDPTYQYSENWAKRLFEEYVWGPCNLTKRVIAIPGDEIRGTVEDGKPVIYLNGVKLDEPYLNKFPLIRVWREDPAVLRDMIDQELASISRGGILDQSVVERIVEQKLIGQTSLKSYDPEKPFEQQPFYRINPNRIIRGADGEPDIIKPGTLIAPLAENAENKSEQQEKKNYWNGTDEFYLKLGKNDYFCMGDNRLGSKDCRSFGPINGSLIHGRIIFRIWSVDSDESWWILDLLRHPIDFWSRVRWDRFFSRLS